MTKILYLPTGEYLTFKSYYGEFTEIFENIDPDEYYTAEENKNSSLLEQIVISANMKSNFVTRNNIIQPSVEEHFEIVEE